MFWRGRNGCECNYGQENCSLIKTKGWYRKVEKLNYSEFTSRMREHNDKTNADWNKAISGVIVFTEDSFDKIYPLESRSYGVSSHNKAWIAGMGGYSIYGSALDGSDNGVRLEAYMALEKGGKNGWKVEYCYFTESEA